MIHPDLTNLTLLRAMRDEALALSDQAAGAELRLAFRMLSNACGYIANVIEKEDLRLRLGKSDENVQELEQLVMQLRIELTKCMDKENDA